MENNNDEVISTQEMIHDARERRKNGTTSFSCEQCNFMSSSKTLFQRHKNQNHKDKPIETQASKMRKRFTCDECGFNAAMENILRKHKETNHEPVLPKKVSNLKTTSTTSKSKSKRINCSQCDKRFNKKETYQKHIATHHGKEIQKNQETMGSSQK